MRKETGVSTAGSRSEQGRKELGHRIDGLKRDVVRPAAYIITKSITVLGGSVLSSRSGELSE